MLVMPRFELEDFCHAIQTHKITLTYVAPPVLVKLSRSESVKSYDLSSLRMITCGAAPLTKELVTTIHSKLGLKVNQAYGLSETNPMTHTQVSSKSPIDTASIHRDTLTCHSHGKTGSTRWAP